MREFLKTGSLLIPTEKVLRADYSSIEDLRLTIFTVEGPFVIEGIDALESAMVLNPACLEGKRLRWSRWVWAFHNLVGHPLMQVLAGFKMYRWAFWVHDKTVPKPRGTKMTEDTKATWKIFHPDCQRVPQAAANFTEWFTQVEFQTKLALFANKYRSKAVEADRRANEEVVLAVGMWNDEKWLFLEKEGVVRYDWPDAWKDEG